MKKILIAVSALYRVFECSNSGNQVPSPVKIRNRPSSFSHSSQRPVLEFTSDGPSAEEEYSSSSDYENSYEEGKYI